MPDYPIPAQVRRQIIIALANLILVIQLSVRSAGAAGITNCFSFSEETKIKGPFVQIGGELFFVSEKGGAYAYGYVGKFNPTNRSLTVLSEFQVETKAKGLARMGNDLWFVTEKGGASNYGYVGRFSRLSNTLERLCDFTALVSAKSAPFILGTNGFFFFTEQGGAYGSGALMRYSQTGGLVIAASLTTNLGIKAEAQPVFLNGRLYYGGREGGDLTQQSGKGAGSIGAIDLAGGVVTKLIDLNASNHGARVKSMLPFGDRLYYATDEGGDLTLNAGKGSGAVGFYDPVSNTLTRLFVCNGTTTGVKPKSLIAVEDRIYFNCGEGAADSCGAFYMIVNGTQVVMVATNDVSFGNKSDQLTLYGQRLYCATEQGCGGWLGGNSAYEFDAAPPQLQIQAQNGQVDVKWPLVANDYWLEYCPAVGAEWTAVAGPGATNAILPISGQCGIFRLRR